MDPARDQTHLWHVFQDQLLSFVLGIVTDWVRLSGHESLQVMGLCSSSPRGFGCALDWNLTGFAGSNSEFVPDKGGPDLTEVVQGFHAEFPRVGVVKVFRNVLPGAHEGKR